MGYLKQHCLLFFWTDQKWFSFICRQISAKIFKAEVRTISLMPVFRLYLVRESSVQIPPAAACRTLQVY